MQRINQRRKDYCSCSWYGLRNQLFFTAKYTLKMIDEEYKCCSRCEVLNEIKAEAVIEEL